MRWRIGATSHGGSSPTASAWVGVSQKDNVGFFSERCINPCRVVGQYELVGQFRSADGLALLAAGSWGLRFPVALPF
jgi:hypothetical protein